VSDKSSWFLVKDSFFNVVSDQYFPECHFVVTKHLNKSVCPSLATVNKRMFPDGYLTFQLFGVKIIHVHSMGCSLSGFGLPRECHVIGRKT
jgi:hypothetical protein